jgi:hypothetical protein
VEAIGHARAADGQVGDFAVDLPGHLPGFLRCRHFGVNGVVKRPDGGAGMDELAAQQVLVFREFTAPGHP